MEWQICVWFSNGLIFKWWSEFWTEKGLFMVKNVYYYNDWPGHMTNHLNTRLPKCLVFRWLLYWTCLCSVIKCPYHLNAGYICQVVYKCQYIRLQLSFFAIQLPGKCFWCSNAIGILYHSTMGRLSTFQIHRLQIQDLFDPHCNLFLSSFYWK